MCKLFIVEDLLDVGLFKIFWDLKLRLIYIAVGSLNITELILSAWLCSV